MEAESVVKYLQKAIDYIEAHLDASLHLDTLAEHVGFSI